jgi:hypothetical protein
MAYQCIGICIGLKKFRPEYKIARSGHLMVLDLCRLVAQISFTKNSQILEITRGTLSTSPKPQLPFTLSL